MAYLPTGVTSVGRAFSLYMGRVPGFGFGAAPILRPVFSRSSLHVAQGQASRSHGNVYALRWPSFQSISMPVPAVLFTRTALGSVAFGSEKRLCSSILIFPGSSAGATLSGSWDIALVFHKAEKPNHKGAQRLLDRISVTRCVLRVLCGELRLWLPKLLILRKIALSVLIIYWIVQPS